MIRLSMISALIAMFAVGLLTSCGGNSNDGGFDRSNLGTPNTVSTPATQSTGPIYLPSQPVYSSASTVNCAVNVASLVTSGQTVSLTVSGSGGTAPYHINATNVAATPFYGSTTISGAFINSTSANQVETKTFTISDSVGYSGTCTFTVTVAPASGSTGGLIPTSGATCNLTASTTTPSRNVAFPLTITGPTGVAFQLISLSLFSNWTITPNTSITSAATYNVTYVYDGPTTVTAVVQVNGVQSTCSLPLTVIN